MKIGIIGTGAIGGTIAKKMALAGHSVKINNSDDVEKLNARAEELGVTAANQKEVVKDVDVIILSLPTIAIPTLPKDLFADVPENVIVVDTSNYYPFRDADIEEIKNGKVESVWVSEQLGRPVIKAFNTLLAETLASGGKKTGAEDRIAMAVAGDDAEAKKVIAGLVNDAGFDVVDSGNLSESWRHQPGTPAYCTELDAAELKQALVDGVKENAPILRDKAIAELSARSSYPSHPDVVEYNRELFEKNPRTK
ncbi:NAD(P)-binding domain-containing protein [Sphingobacterium paramultivorum]|uniref:NAD(P)-binding domain-containing protein n=1 Tax=Sphingobacterium paramultivorum TaxID=2886510 RepID=A0A7G5E1P5_9SPHI|nr:NAD(P)-binding domain-containing protein [Sphingobacterium paramultivorum]QMV67920.1 NAD(P)-binding domain-containing protein [Sphingobacterium paramultivorum]WSO16818.1 NAD(P)-binding domain-containing protein [Sphingobacterium paramultivorum]